MWHFKFKTIYKTTNLISPTQYCSGAKELSWYSGNSKVWEAILLLYLFRNRLEYWTGGADLYKPDLAKCSTTVQAPLRYKLKEFIICLMKSTSFKMYYSRASIIRLSEIRPINNPNLTSEKNYFFKWFLQKITVI